MAKVFPEELRSGGGVLSFGNAIRSFPQPSNTA